MDGVFLKRGQYTYPLDKERVWHFVPLVNAGDKVQASEPEENAEEPEVEESAAEVEEVQKGEPESESESESVIVQEEWDENVFEYQGYHFKAVGVLPQGLEGKELVNQTRGNTELHLTTYEREDDILYSYAGFYEASGSSKADIFRCMETGRNYKIYI